MDRLTVVSADGHAGLMPGDYRPYLTGRALEHFDDFVADSNRYRDVLYEIVHYSDETLELIDDRDAIRSGGVSGAWDTDRRLKEMDDEGIAAEMVIYNHQLAAPPFFGTFNRPWDAELRAEGVQAFHRFIADYKSAAEDRFLAMGEAGPCVDMDATVRELHWIGERGFKLVELPGLCVDPDLPPLYSDYYEPVWRTCAEHGMALGLHAGWGSVQGAAMDRFEQYIEQAGGIQDFDLSKVPREGRSGPQGAVESSSMMTTSDEDPTGIGPNIARAMWQLMLGGVFDRYPDLRLVLVEVRAGWIPSTLAVLDARFDEGDSGMRMRPSEYYQRNVWMAPSFVQRAEIETRHEIGVSKMMFARDYPHLEGTWPNTHDWIRAAFAGVPLDEARMILGDNAIECFHLDRTKLDAIAQRIGPRPEELLGDQSVRPDLVEHFDARGGYHKPLLTFDPGELDRQLATDIAGVGAATPA